jgi:hypothetical protein
VFEEGESKPEKQKKKSKPAKPGTNGLLDAHSESRKRKSNPPIDSQVSKKPNIANYTNGAMRSHDPQVRGVA